MKAEKDRLPDSRMWHRVDGGTREDSSGGPGVENSVAEQNWETKNTVWKTLNMK